MADTTTSILGDLAIVHSMGGDAPARPDPERLTVRLARESAVVDAAIQLWADSGIDRLDRVARAATAAFYTWLRTNGIIPRNGGYAVRVLDALLEAMESLFADDTPARDRVFPAFLDGRLDLIRDWRMRQAHSAGDPIAHALDDLVGQLREALADFGPHLRQIDEAAWSAVGACLLDEAPHFDFLRRVLHGRCGLPEWSGNQVHRLWMAMADAYCGWEVDGVVEGLRHTARGHARAA